MAGKSQHETSRIVDFFVTGQNLIHQGSVLDSELYSINEKWTGLTGSESLKDFLAQIAKPFSKMSKPSYLKNPDLFFSLLQYGVICDQTWDKKLLAAHKHSEPKDFLLELLSPLEISTNSIALNDRLRTSMQSQFCDNDEKLKLRADERLSIKDHTLVGQEKPTIYTKINHGYWEFALNSFVDLTGNGRYRDLSQSRHPDSWRDTGFHAALLDALFTHPAKTQIGVSLSAGERPFLQSISGELDPVARGALNGLLGFIDALETNYPVPFLEGSAPRDLFKERQYETFFADQLNQYDAVLLVIPPTLRQLTFPQYGGDIFRLAIPGQVVHETYRVVLPTLLGSLEELKAKYQSVCVITQSAVFAPIAAIAIEQITNANDDVNNVSFFDLGRVLDVVHPERLITYRSLAWVIETGLNEKISNFIKLDEGTPNYGVYCANDQR